VRRIFEANLAALRRQQLERLDVQELEPRVEALLVLTLAAYNKTDEEDQPLHEAWPIALNS
jgi:hypothetical protein